MLDSAPLETLVDLLSGLCHAYPHHARTLGRAVAELRAQRAEIDRLTRERDAYLGLACALHSVYHAIHALGKKPIHPDEAVAFFREQGARPTAFLLEEVRRAADLDADATDPDDDPEPTAPPDARAVHVALLISEGESPDESVLASLTQFQRNYAFVWAHCEASHASDNEGVLRLPRPDFLPPAKGWGET